MAGKGKASRGSAPRRKPPATSRARTSGTQKPAPRKKPAPRPPVPEAPDLTPRQFRLGAVPGATPGKWIDTWHERLPHVTLELVPITLADQRAALDNVDAALVRLPLDDATLHVIPLYTEVPVIVASVDSALTAADELSLGDLAGEVYVAPADTVYPELQIPDAAAPRFAAPETTEDAIATVATGIGFTVVPMSLARAHRRKDVTSRPLLDGPASTVALAWRREHTTDDVDAFVGIVRGRTANSSR